MDQPSSEQHKSWQRSENGANVYDLGFQRNDEVTVPSRTVLLVEDEWLLRQSLYEEMTVAGWRVLEAASGERALEILAGGETVDLLVTDIRLDGGITGWEVAEACRTANARLPVVYVSGNSPDDSRRVEGSVFLSKPCMIERLLAACHMFFIA
ncbi:MAG TPA: response regulator [Micropepsaceae bacterium]|nr:response regulator [Micropepsaceae bacterium]